MISADVFIDPLRRLGFSQYVGVPCSYLKPFINYVIAEPSLDYIGAASEGEAVGISMGAHLGGRRTVTMCQNSGLGNMVNPLTSLCFPFRVPTLLIVTWRGQPGTVDEPQHEQMGRITQDLLETLEIPWESFPQRQGDVEDVLGKADAYLTQQQRPFALVMTKNTVAPFELAAAPSSPVVKTEVTTAGSSGGDGRPTRTEALKLILGALEGDEALVATTGKTGRELFTLDDRPGNLYVVGGMGTAAAIGLGIAHARPDRRVVVIDGDGSALMKMGCFATIGYHQPRNLLHVVLDNEQHDSTGGQQTVSRVVRFHEVAAATNYRTACFAGDGPAFVSAMKQCCREDGPSLLHAKIAPGSPADLGRPTIQPHEVRDRFMRFLQTS